jgi:hypothetical protein
VKALIKAQGNRIFIPKLKREACHPRPESLPCDREEHRRAEESLFDACISKKWRLERSAKPSLRAPGGRVAISGP